MNRSTEAPEPVPVMNRSTETSASTTADLHKALTALTTQDMGRPSARDAAMGQRLHLGGLTRTGEHWLGVRRRGSPVQHEAAPANGQAALWLRDVELVAPASPRDVARQLARLCGDDSVVVIPDRKLADAVGVKDRAGRPVAYMQRGVQWLTESGWLAKEVTGLGAGARTTYYLNVPAHAEVYDPDSIFARVWHFGAMAEEEWMKLHQA